MNFSDENGNQPIISIGHVQLDGNKGESAFDPNALPILPTRNLVLFPEVTIPIKLVRENSLRLAQQAQHQSVSIGIVCQKDPQEDSPTVDGLYRYGVLADVVQVIKLPDDSFTAIVRARGKFKIISASTVPVAIEADLVANVKPIKEITPKSADNEFSAICDDIKKTALKLASKTNDLPKDLDLLFNLANGGAEGAEIVNAVATHIPFEISFKMTLLSMFRVKERALTLLTELARHEEMLSIAESVHQKARESFDDQQRRSFLQRQMEAIDRELNGDDNDIDTLRSRADDVRFPTKVAEVFDKELTKLARLNPQTPDYSVQYAYLDTLLELPWNVETTLNDNFNIASEILDTNHYGLEKVKERVLEQIAVLINNPEGKAPILCLVGPPGVGKTSLGQSIATAVGRKFQRISLGGLHDEAEIRGHRRTYIGAMPGRIIAAMRRAGSSNPVLMLDEIDKIGADYKGDPASALLEVLDPEQNCRFHDNYIDVDFDLSKVLFIATANNISTLPSPLIDRMEVIDLSGYLLEEKIGIARKHLLPRVLQDLNLTSDPFDITDDALTAIIERYTAESGVRQLEKALASIARKVILRRLSKRTVPSPIGREDLRDLLGVEKYSRDAYEGNDFAGVVTGLAWTAVGGEILFIESSLNPGKGEKLTLTGNLGDVMKESAMIALQYIKAHAKALNVDAALFEKYNLHIHVPEGAIPKDGPSAGITMATSILSAFRQCRVKDRLAMTGEITLRGRVLPVGGIKEKILAARRAGITDIILSKENRKDIEDIPDKYLSGLTFHYVSTVMDVFGIALTDERASDAMDL